MDHQQVCLRILILCPERFEKAFLAQEQSAERKKNGCAKVEKKAQLQDDMQKLHRKVITYGFS